MPLLEWSDELSCNVREIDEQHKRLVGMLNRLHQAMVRREGQRLLASILGELMDYTTYHFATEEKYMALFHYPGFQSHSAEHEDFVRTVSRFQKQYENGDVGLSISVLNFLSSWLRDHIMGSDKAFGPFFNANGLCGYEAAEA
ncbi:MAG: bacteriohemerythrin [Methanomassiliicoccales archaeon]|nr:bacteriohemerythrin [Methanomassiliicoccales archaeon]